MDGEWKEPDDQIEIDTPRRVIVIDGILRYCSFGKSYSTIYPPAR